MLLNRVQAVVPMLLGMDQHAADEDDAHGVKYWRRTSRLDVPPQVILRELVERAQALLLRHAKRPCPSPSPASSVVRNLLFPRKRLKSNHWTRIGRFLDQAQIIIRICAEQFGKGASVDAVLHGVKCDGKKWFWMRKFGSVPFAIGVRFLFLGTVTR